MEPICVCGLVAELAKLAGTPLRRGTREDGWSLRLNPSAAVPFLHCVHCGGGVSASDCRCGGPANWSRLPGSCVQRDDALEEYQLVIAGRTIPMRFCSACGGTLDSSRRRLFQPRSEEEERSITEQLRGVNSIAGVIAVLGPPDARSGPPRLADPRVMPIRQTLMYTRLAATLRVFVQELEAGGVRVVFAGKPISGSNVKGPAV
jgi:hypothetical protein